MAKATEPNDAGRAAAVAQAATTDDGAAIGPVPIMAQPSGLAGALVRGTLWSVGLRWFVRLTGFLTTIVVARLLLPEDYGLLALAMLVIGLVQTFVDSGAATALLRLKEPSKAMVDSAWTLNLVQSLLVTAIVVAVAPLAARFFADPRLTWVVIALAPTVAMWGLGSIGPLLARKEFAFGLEFKVTVIMRVVSLVATIGAALVLRDYWALVIGALLGSLAYLVASYALHPYRPRFTFAHFGELWGFSQWMLVSGIGVYLARKVDGLVVGRVGTASEVGLYNLSLEVGSMITGELGAPLNRALLPVLAALQDEPARMRSALMETVAAVNLLTLPAGIGLALVAPYAVEVVFGPQWIAAAPLLAVFSFIGAIRFLVGPYYTLFLTVGRSRILASMSWAELAAFAAFAYWFLDDGVTGIAEARFLSCIVIVAAWVVLGRQHGLRVHDLVAAVARPLLGCALMASALWSLPAIDAPAIVQLAYRVAVGGAIYVAWIGGSWLAQGRPDGFEKRVFGMLAAQLSRSRR